MIPEIGHFALVLALMVALVQASVPLIGAEKGRASWIALARPAAVGQFLFVAIGFGALMHSYVVSDFSVQNVFANSHSDKPMLYKVSGVWGNHEGSLVLWVTILAVFGLLVALVGRNLPPRLRARTLSVQAMISAGFLLFILLTSNPFLRLDPAPADGRGLNPMLQDPGLAFHPPMLYLGYVGFSMAFSFAVAALIEGRVDPAWARWVRPWTLAAWVALTLGIALGSWWAYYTLGWGGWWFWDPVENASFIPWLAGTALLHSAIVVEKRDSLKSWTVLLAIVTFSLSLLGTFLVRSGILTSVHAFASDPTRGVFVLLLLAVAVGGSLLLFAVRAPALRAGGLFAPVSREGGLLLNNVLLSAAAATVLLGTLYPLIADALALGKVSVGAPFFNATFVPLMVPLAVAMAAGPLLAWKRGDLNAALRRLWAAGAASVLAFGLAWWMGGAAPLTLPAAGGIALAVWLLAGTLAEFAERIRLFRAPMADAVRRAASLPGAAWGMTLAHAGFAVVIAGIAGASAWDVEKVQTMRPGDTVAIAGYDITFDGSTEVDGPNYAAVRAAMTVRRDGRTVTVLHPEKRLYRQPAIPSTQAAIHSNGTVDLYAAIGDEDDKGGTVTRVYFKPMVPLLWYGAGLMALGGLVSLSDRRHRVGAPARRKPGVA